MVAGKDFFHFDGMDEIGRFWVVTEPWPDSELADFLFEVDIFDFMLQLRGGLIPAEILLITKDKLGARQYARDLLARDIVD